MVILAENLIAELGMYGIQLFGKQKLGAMTTICHMQCILIFPNKLLEKFYTD